MFFRFGIVRSGQPGAQGARKFPAQPCLGIGRAVYDLDLRSHADRLLCVLSALSSARNDRFQFLPFLVAHLDDRSLAVGVGMVFVGVASAQWARRAAVGGRAPDDRSAWATDLCLA